MSVWDPDSSPCATLKACQTLTIDCNYDCLSCISLPPDPSFVPHGVVLSCNSSLFHPTLWLFCLSSQGFCPQWTWTHFPRHVGVVGFFTFSIGPSRGLQDHHHLFCSRFQNSSLTSSCRNIWWSLLQLQGVSAAVFCWDFFCSFCCFVVSQVK